MDVPYIVLICFIFGIMVLIGYSLMSNVNTQLQGQDDFAAKGKTIVQDSTDSYIATFDAVFGFIFIGLSLAVVIGAFLLDTHPVFFIVSLLITVIWIVFAGVLSNAYYQVEITDQFVSFAEDFRITHYILNHIPHYIVIQMFLVGIALYGKMSL